MNPKRWAAMRQTGVKTSDDPIDSTKYTASLIIGDERLYSA